MVEEGHKISETARNLGINANMPSRWKGELDRPAEVREAEARDRQGAEQAEEREPQASHGTGDTQKKRRPSLRANQTTTPVHTAA